jgi:exodeoxyribonuclease VII large subunit
MDNGPPPPAGARINLPEYSVSEISNAIRRTMEDSFGHVRVRGEISQPKIPGSGHLYFTLKDDKANLDAVCWRGTVSKLQLKPEDGMEVICTGRITTYAGRSKYQIVVEAMELAGEGALLKLLEERKKKLQAEGLFDPARKKPLPFIPEVIGIVTSPTGAVIEDILHRLNDRFPRPVLLWPVRVQGETAAVEVASAIEGFNKLPETGELRRPDLLIVARGGGSLEDLWAFNEEIVVRAAAASEIPLISAVGHETDTTLIDFAADRRAPTPTAAAEIAVPVRRELVADVLQGEERLLRGVGRFFEQRSLALEGLARGLPDPARLLEQAMQSLDIAGERWTNGLLTIQRNAATQLQHAASRLVAPERLIADKRREAEHALERIGNRLQQRLGELRLGYQQLAARLISPETMLAEAERDHRQWLRALGLAMQRLEARDTQRLGDIAGRLDPEHLRRGTRHAEENLAETTSGFSRAAARYLERAGEALAPVSRSLEVVSYQSILSRGFAMVLDSAGATVTHAARTHPGQKVRLFFADGEARATIDSGDGTVTPPPRSAASAIKRKKRKPDSDKNQGDLF